jgi:ribonuclease E
MSLGENNQEICPHCQGHGMVRSIYSNALSLIRVIEEEAIKPNVVEVCAELPIQIATFLLNEKRDMIINIGKQNNVEIMILPNPHFELSQSEIRHTTGDKKRKKASYDLITEPELKVLKSDELPNRQPAPAIKMEQHQSRHPASKEKIDSLFIRLWRSLFGSEEASREAHKNKSNHRDNQNRNRSHQNRRHHHNRNQQRHHHNRKRHHGQGGGNKSQHQSRNQGSSRGNRQGQNQNNQQVKKEKASSE